jgi:hypothetical protein
LRGGMTEDRNSAQLAAEREHQQDLHRRLLSIIELLHGLPVGEAEHTLNEAKRIMKSVVLVDAKGPGHAELVGRLSEWFGTEMGPGSVQ